METWRHCIVEGGLETVSCAMCGKSREIDWLCYQIEYQPSRQRTKGIPKMKSKTT